MTLVRLPDRNVTLLIYNGWDKLDVMQESGRIAAADDSTVLYAYCKRTEQNPAMELMISVMLHKADDENWTADQLDIINDFRIMDVTASGFVLGCEVTLSTGNIYMVDFKDVDSYKSC